MLALPCWESFRLSTVALRPTEVDGIFNVYFVHQRLPDNLRSDILISHGILCVQTVYISRPYSRPLLLGMILGEVTTGTKTIPGSLGVGIINNCSGIS